MLLFIKIYLSFTTFKSINLRARGGKALASHLMVDFVFTHCLQEHCWVIPGALVSPISPVWIH